MAIDKKSLKKIFPHLYKEIEKVTNLRFQLMLCGKTLKPQRELLWKKLRKKNFLSQQRC